MQRSTRRAPARPTAIFLHARLRRKRALPAPHVRRRRTRPPSPGPTARCAGPSTPPSPTTPKASARSSLSIRHAAAPLRSRTLHNIHRRLPPSTRAPPPRAPITSEADRNMSATVLHPTVAAPIRPPSRRRAPSHLTFKAATSCTAGDPPPHAPPRHPAPTPPSRAQTRSTVHRFRPKLPPTKLPPPVLHRRAPPPVSAGVTDRSPPTADHRSHSYVPSPRLRRHWPPPRGHVQRRPAHFYALTATRASLRNRTRCTSPTDPHLPPPHTSPPFHNHAPPRQSSYPTKDHSPVGRRSRLHHLAHAPSIPPVQRRIPPSFKPHSRCSTDHRSPKPGTPHPSTSPHCSPPPFLRINIIINIIIIVITKFLGFLQAYKKGWSSKHSRGTSLSTASCQKARRSTRRGRGKKNHHKQSTKFDSQRRVASSIRSKEYYCS